MTHRSHGKTAIMHSRRRSGNTRKNCALLPAEREAGFRVETGRRQWGFTLLEIVVVLIVITVLMGMVGPRIGGGWKHMEEHEFLQDFAHTLRKARIYAMNSGRVAFFRIRGGTDRVYGLEDPPEYSIPANVDIYAEHLEADPDTGDHLVIFYPDGSPSGGNIEVVFNKGRSYRMFIHPLTGNMRWIRLKSRR